MASPSRAIGLAIKRAADVVGAGLLLVLVAPLMALVAVLIKLDSRGPVFFRQERLGLNGRRFRIFKFRTMIPGASQLGTGLVSVAGDPRATRFGNFLRKYRIDELPQLFNVIRGEMSLVGPRPLVPDHAHLWTEHERKRLWMRPGITGWQQVQGGATLAWEQRVALEVWYVEHWSLWLDLKILLLTPLVVLRADTVYGQDGQERSAIPTRRADVGGISAAPGVAASENREVHG